MKVNVPSLGFTSIPLRPIHPNPARTAQARSITGAESQNTAYLCGAILFISSAICVSFDFTMW